MNNTTPVGRLRVVVGVDGSPASLEAVQWAVRYAHLTGALVEAVTSWSMPNMYGSDFATGYGSLELNWPDLSAEIQETALTTALPEGSTTIKRTVVCDHPAMALVNASTGADLLVVGSRGHGGFAGMLLGSVSAYVVAHALCPVVVIRHLPESAAAGSGAQAPEEVPLGPVQPLQESSR